MRVIEIAPFLLPVRIRLDSLLAEQHGTAPERQFAQLCADVASVLPAPARPAAAPPADADPEVFISEHRSLGAAEIENTVYDEVLHIGGIGEVRLYISSLSIGFAIISLDVDNLDALHAREHELVARLNTAIGRWCELIASAVPAAQQSREPWGTLRPARVLWWHRLMVDPPAEQQPEAILCYGTPCTLGTGTCLVGNGYTAVLSVDEDCLADVLEGLLYAQQRWILIDEANKFIGKRHAAMGNRHQAGFESVEEQFTEVLGLTRAVVLRDVILRNQSRHLANARWAVSQAADTVWRTADEAGQLDDQLTSLRILANLDWQRLQNSRDDRRNQLIFIFTVVTLFQSILLWYDFLTNQATAQAGEPRSGIAYVVLVLSVAVLAAALWGQWWHGCRRLYSRISSRLRDRFSRRRLVPQPVPVSPPLPIPPQGDPPAAVQPTGTPEG